MQMKIPNIKFDLDGCLIDWSSYFRALMNNMGFTVRDTGGFYWDLYNEKGQKLSYEDASYFVYASMEHVEEFHPMPGARSFLTWFYEFTNRPVQVITHRPYQVAGYTHQVFERLFPGVPFTISFVLNTSDKPLFMGDSIIFYEDRRKTAVEMAELGFTVFMPMRDYNWPISECTVPVVELNKLDPKIEYQGGPWLKDGGRIIAVYSILDLQDKRVVNLLFK